MSHFSNFLSILVIHIRIYNPFYDAFRSIINLNIYNTLCIPTIFYITDIFFKLFAAHYVGTKENGSKQKSSQGQVFAFQF